MSLNDHFWGDEKSFVAGFLRGYRAWKFDRTRCRLRSTSYPDVFWQPGMNVADCQNKVGALRGAGILHCSCTDCERSKSKILAMQAEKAELFKNHRAPSRNKRLCNTCGFYAFNFPSMMNREFGGYIPATVAVGLDDAIFGSIKATGRIVVGTLGFRAERVEVEALYGRNGQQSAYGPAAAAAYGVPWFETEEELLQAYPPTPVDGIKYETPGQDWNQRPSIAIGGGGSGTWTWIAPSIQSVQYTAAWISGNPFTITITPEPEPEPEPEMLVLESGARLKIDYNAKRWPLLPKLDPRSWFWKAPPDGIEP